MNIGKNWKDKGFLGRRLLQFGIVLLVISLVHYSEPSQTHIQQLCTVKNPMYKISISTSNNQINITYLRYNDSVTNNQINHETEEKKSILSRETTETTELVSAFLSLIGAIVGLFSTCLGGFLVYLNYKERKEKKEN